MLICPTCQQHFEGEEHFCPQDGTPLQALGDAQRGDPLVGRVLGGRYRLVARLGQGGMGTVYRALHTMMDKPVAVKVLRAELSSDAEAVARFHREARSASRLDHEHCIRVTDFGQSDDGLLYLVMELLDGVSLGQLLARGPLPAARAAAIGVSIAEALAHAHEQSVIHRDLKPDNVFLVRRSRGRELVKVLDFGLAKIVADGALTASITRDGTIFGTPEYMAPEQAEGERLDGRTDVYALGVILYQLITGEVPFRATHFVALLTKQVSEAPVPPRERRPDLDIPAELEDIVLRCMEKRPDDRFPTAQAVADALLPLAQADPSQRVALVGPPSGEHTPVPAPDEAPARPPDSLSVLSGEVLRRPPLGRRLAVGLGGAAVVAAMALGGAWLALHVGSAPTQPPAAPAAPAPPPEAEARRLLEAGDLVAAGRALADARARFDSSELQEVFADWSERRGNRLAALAHLERAARLAPTDARPRGRLAALLLRMGQKKDACRAAEAALKLDPSGARAPDARTIVTQARCKEAP